MKQFHKLLSIIIVNLCFYVFVLSPVRAERATSATLGFKQTKYSGDEMTVSVLLQTGGSKVNAVKANFTYPSNLLEVISLNTANPLFEHYIDKDYSKPGVVRLSCYELDGVVGGGSIATVTFRGKASGTVTLAFSDDVAVLDADSANNILSKSEDSIFYISEYKKGKILGDTVSDDASLEFRHKDLLSDVILTSVYLNTGGELVNGVTADFSYPSTLLRVEKIDISNSIFDNFIEQDFTTSSDTVYLSCYSLEGVSGEGEIATVQFRVLQNGKATLEFTDSAAVAEASTSTNILGETDTGTYTINEDLSVLPETGVTTGSAVLDALIIIIALVMLALFVIAGFTMWGGIYLSLGKWEVEGRYEVGIGKDGIKKSKTQKKAKAKKAVTKKKKK